MKTTFKSNFCEKNVRRKLVIKRGLLPCCNSRTRMKFSSRQNTRHVAKKLDDPFREKIFPRRQACFFTEWFINVNMLKNFKESRQVIMFAEETKGFQIICGQKSHRQILIIRFIYNIDLNKTFYFTYVYSEICTVFSCTLQKSQRACIIIVNRDIVKFLRIISLRKYK